MPHAESMDPPAGVPPAWPAPLRILLVDDCPHVLRFARHALSGLGHAVTACGDPREALALYRDAPGNFDLVITDYAMPHLDGLQLVDQLRRVRADGAFMMITATGPEQSERQLRTVGIRKLLLKPFSASALAAAVQDAIW